MSSQLTGNISWLNRTNKERDVSILSMSNDRRLIASSLQIRYLFIYSPNDSYETPVKIPRDEGLLDTIWTCRSNSVNTYYQIIKHESIIRMPLIRVILKQDYITLASENPLFPMQASMKSFTCLPSAELSDVLATARLGVWLYS